MNEVMIKCDDCAAVFAPRQATKEITPGIEWTFIMCPRCGTRYTVTLTDAGMRADMVRMRAMSQGAAGDPGTRRRYEKLKKSLRERDKALRAQYRLVR